MRIRTRDDASPPRRPSPSRGAQTSSSRPEQATVDLNRLGNTAFFARLIQTDDPDLPFYGLNHLTARGVDLIAQWAKTHDPCTGEVRSPSSSGRIDANARAIMGAILEHQEYPGWFAQGTIPKIRDLFGLNEPPIQGPPPGIRVSRPDRRVEIPEGASKWPPGLLSQGPCLELPKLFEAELEENKAEINRADPGGAPRGRLALGLLKSYADALWARGQHTLVEQVGHQLLDVLERFTRGDTVANEDFNGAGWSAAQSLVLGLDANEFPRHFPAAMPNEQFTYLYFDGKLAEPMGYVDQYRAALGKETGAKALEQRSMLAFVLGQRSGHTKFSVVMKESEPFATTGLNWGVLLFPGDEEVARLPPRPGFEFPIDCLASSEYLVIAAPPEDYELRAEDRTGRPLTAERVIHRSASGAAESWSARFRDAEGREVAPRDVVGRVWTRSGLALGDGRADLEKSLRWWGFCDINTAQRLYKTKYGIPELDRAIVPVRAGAKIIEIPRDMAQRLLDCSVSDLPSRESHCGFRFDDLPPQHLHLNDGRSVEGRVGGLQLRNTRTSTRVWGDWISVPNTPRRTMLGPVAVDGQVVVERSDGEVQRIALEDITAVSGHTEDDVRPSQYMAWISQHGGLFASDSAVGAPVSNGIRWVNQIDIEARTDAEVPAWAQKQLQGRPLVGLQGDVVRERKDKMLWVRGLYGSREQVEDRASGDPERLHIQFGAWIQVNQRGRIINEGFISGQPDFGWNAEGPLDWSRPSNFNPFMEPDFRLQLLVNGVEDISKLEALADRLNLPAGWRDLRV